MIKRIRRRTNHETRQDSERDMKKKNPFEPLRSSNGSLMAYQPMKENPALRYFEPTPQPDCVWCSTVTRPRRKADGVLRGAQNESYGPHCKLCAARRLRNAERVRAALAAGFKPEPR